MATESAMYSKMRDFVVTHWQAADVLTKHDSGPDARGRGITLRFGDARVEPDIYGIVTSNAVEIPILGEGKLRMGGHEGTRAFGQALAYRNLGMLSFLFFPEVEFGGEAARMFQAMCAQAGIGLVSVPAGARRIDPVRDVVVDVAGGDPHTVTNAIDQTLSDIKRIGQRYLDHIYPSSLRDVLALFAAEHVSHDQLMRRFQKRWPRFRDVLTQRPYDPMVAVKIERRGAAAAREYLDKFVRGLSALSLVGPTSTGWRTTNLGEQVRRSIRADDQFDSTVRDELARLFSFAVMREFEKPILEIIETLREVGGPVSSRPMCFGRNCKARSPISKWSLAEDRWTLRCPDCGSSRVEPGIWWRPWIRTRGEADVSYPLLKFATACGIFEKRSPKRWSAKFPRVPVETAAGAAINWKFYWYGPALGA